MCYPYGANNEEYYSLMAAVNPKDGDYQRWTREFVDSEPSENDWIETTVPTELETNAAEGMTQRSSARSPTTADLERISVVTEAILYPGLNPSSKLQNADRSFATEQSKIHRNQASKAKLTKDPTEFSELKTEIERKVFDHIVQSEHYERTFKRPAKTLFGAIITLGPEVSLDNCPDGSSEFVRGMMTHYQRRLKDERTGELWKTIGNRFSEFMAKKQGRMVESLDIEG